jgi:hypothetical protein
MRTQTAWCRRTHRHATTVMAAVIAAVIGAAALGWVPRQRLVAG